LNTENRLFTGNRKLQLSVSFKAYRFPNINLACHGEFKATHPFKSQHHFPITIMKVNNYQGLVNTINSSEKREAHTSLSINGVKTFNLCFV